MQNKGLLFIPDISGFTRFVNETEIEHSRLIIQELLEILINSNTIGLEISEIEGDAILFYKYGDPPDLKSVYRQVEEMFCAFHRSLIAYEHTRYCQCTACMSAIKLTLKVITHYGEFTGYNVKNFSKLIGKDIIVAHQLLKNDIENHEYWLITRNLLGNVEPEGFASWMKWNSSTKQTENGEVVFQYTPLSPLRNELPSAMLPQLALDRKVKMISLQQEYETDIITLFHATGDFNYRVRWYKGIEKIEVVGHFLPRVGMKCRCLLESGEEVIIYASNYTYTPDRIQFSETDEKKKSATWFTLEKVNDRKTRLTLDFYVKKDVPGELLFRLTKKNSWKTGCGSRWRIFLVW
jgi:hypothetical protein